MNYLGVCEAALGLPCYARGLPVSTLAPLSLPTVGWACTAVGCSLSTHPSSARWASGATRPVAVGARTLGACALPCSSVMLHHCRSLSGAEPPHRRRDTPLPPFSHSTHFLLSFSISATVSLSFWTCLYLALPEAAGHFSPCLPGQLM